MIARSISATSSATAVIVALLMSACGGTDPSATFVAESTTTAPQPSTVSEGTKAATSPTTTPNTATSTTAVPVEFDDCERDRRTFEVAVEAFVVTEGRLPATEAELVDAEMLRTEFGSHDLVEGQVVRVPGTPCDIQPAPERDLAEDPFTTDEVFAMLTDEDLDRLGGRDCALEIAAISAAGQNFIGREGREPSTLAEIEGDLDRPIKLWQVSDDLLMPAADSGCIDPNRASTEADTIRACQVERQTLEVAREAYFALNGDVAEPTEDDLVEAELLRAVSDSMDLVDGTITAVPGESCDGIELDSQPLQPDDCDADRRLLEVATEAYRAQYGEWPVEESDLVTSGMLRTASPGHDLLPDGVVVPTPGTACG